MIQIGNRFKAMSSRYPTRKQILVTTMATVLVASRLLYSSANAAESVNFRLASRVAVNRRRGQKRRQGGRFSTTGRRIEEGLKEVFDEGYGIQLELVTGRGSAIAKRLPTSIEPAFDSRCPYGRLRRDYLWFGRHRRAGRSPIYSSGGQGPEKLVGRPYVRGQRQPLWLFVSRLRSGGHLVQQRSRQTGRGPLSRRPFSSQMAGQDRLQRSTRRRRRTGQLDFLWKTKGEEFLKKLVHQKLVIMREERPLAELLVKGSVAITIGLDIDNFVLL